jgi:6-phosphogluconolactonase (cycloisomerase 2 family)
VKQTVGFKILDEHRKEAQNVKGPGIQNFRPHGTLITTLYQHNNPVNTVAVTEDQAFFMTGSRGDKAIHVYKVKKIVDENDTASVLEIDT